MQWTPKYFIISYAPAPAISSPLWVPSLQLFIYISTTALIKSRTSTDSTRHHPVVTSLDVATATFSTSRPALKLES